MKTLITSLICVVLFPTVFAFGQTSPSGGTNHPDQITSGFYFKIGPVIPMGTYSTGQQLPIYNPSVTPHYYTLSYLPAKIGGAMDMGFLIYIGPSFANNFLRAGIDATFLSLWFNSVDPVLNGEQKYEHFYSFAGQKFGPVVTVNPIDKLCLDISYKLCCNIGYHYDEWKDIGLVDAQYSKYGINYLDQEISMGIRYRAILFSFQYDFGTMTYDNLTATRPDQVIPIDTFRILFGLKF
jgi:hypothetical protein